MSRSELASLRATAESQHGVISRKQALEAGLSAPTIRRLVRAGAWLRLYRSVYALWTPAAPDALRSQHLRGASLWLQDSPVSHRASSWLWELDGLDAPPIELTCSRQPRATDGVIVHTRRTVPDADSTIRDGIPVTTVARSLIDLGEVVSANIVEQAYESARRRTLVTDEDLALRLFGELSAGTAAIRALLETPTKAATESKLETLLWQLAKAHALLLPVRQYVVRTEDGHVVARPDFAYPALKIAIEAESVRFHSSKAQQQSDAARFNWLQRARWVVLRFTWYDVTHRAMAVSSEIFEVLRPSERLRVGKT